MSAEQWLDAYPLPFSREMVTATLERRKTEIRRLMLPKWKRGTAERQPAWCCPSIRGYPGATVWDSGVWHTWNADGIGGENGVDSSVEIAQAEAWNAVMRQSLVDHPYRPDGYAYVKEGWWQAGMFQHPPIEKQWHWWDPHGADDVRRVVRYFGEERGERPDPDRTNSGWRQRSGRFMPRWAARILLQVDGVRYERLQSITFAAALLEGIRTYTKDGVLFKYWPCDPYEGPLKRAWSELPLNPIDAFAVLWDSLNAERAPWSANPWVRVTRYHVAEVRHA